MLGWRWQGCKSKMSLYAFNGTFVWAALIKKYRSVLGLLFLRSFVSFFDCLLGAEYQVPQKGSWDNGLVRHSFNDSMDEWAFCSSYSRSLELRGSMSIVTIRHIHM